MKNSDHLQIKQTHNSMTTGIDLSAIQVFLSSRRKCFTKNLAGGKGLSADQSTSLKWWIVSRRLVESHDEKRDKKKLLLPMVRGNITIRTPRDIPYYSTSNACFVYTKEFYQRRIELQSHPYALWRVYREKVMSLKWNFSFIVSRSKLEGRARLLLKKISRFPQDLTAPCFVHLPDWDSSECLIRPTWMVVQIW